jgi:hypothetical protein
MTKDTTAGGVEAVLAALTMARTTAANDDYSKPGTIERERHCQRLEAMQAASDAIGRLVAPPATGDGAGVAAGAPLTREELQAIYAGPHYEAAINLVFGSQDGMTIGEVRDKLRDMLAASPEPAPAGCCGTAVSERGRGAEAPPVASAPSPKAGETGNG